MAPFPARNISLSLDAMKDCFKKTPGVSKVVKKCKAIGKFTHQSTEATKALRKEATKDKIVFKKVVNPPNTRLNDNVDDDDLNDSFIEDDTEDTPPLSPTSQLRKQMSRNQRTFTEDQIDHRLSPIDKEIRRYESFSIAPKDVNIFMW